MKVLAVLPRLNDDNPGGIQVSGGIAWHALQQHTDARLLEVWAARRWAAVKAARQLDFPSDVVLFWHLDLLKLAPLLPATRRRVVYLHGVEAWRRRGRITRTYLRDCTILANSAYTLERARVFNRELQSRHARIVQLGIGEPVGARDAPAATPAALMIGRMDSGERYKGHHEVISAWPAIRHQIPDAQLWIVGDGDLRGELEAHAAASGLGDAVRFFGRISEGEKGRLIRAARCIAMPSRGEGFGLVYLEAMRAGRPCLAGTDAAREVVNPPEAGLMVDPSDMGAITAAMIRLLRQGSDWERMSMAAQQRYETHFTARHFQNRLIAALRELN